MKSEKLRVCDAVLYIAPQKVVVTVGNGPDRSVKLHFFGRMKTPPSFSYENATSPEWEANHPCRRNYIL